MKKSDNQQKVRNHMKLQITAYNVRQDETASFDRFEEELNLKIIRISQPLNLATVNQASGSFGVSILGQNEINDELFQQLEQLNIKALSTRSVGYNNIDLEAARKHGILLAKGYYEPNGVADYTIMHMLMAIRKYKQSMWRAYVNDYSLKGLIGTQLKDMTVGIIGTGNIGAQVIKNLSGFGCRILAWNRHPKEELKSFCNYCSLDELYEQSDIISYHLPLVPATKKMLNAETLAKMKNGVVLINCSRGELMNVPDVIQGIETKKIGALGLDVFEKEEGIYHQDLRTDIISNRDMAYLRQFPNVILTHHIAFYTDAAVSEMVYSGLSSLCDFYKYGKSKLQIQ